MLTNSQPKQHSLAFFHSRNTFTPFGAQFIWGILICFNLDVVIDVCRCSAILSGEFHRERAVMQYPTFRHIWALFNAAEQNIMLQKLTCQGKDQHYFWPMISLLLWIFMSQNSLNAWFFICCRCSPKYGKLFNLLLSLSWQISRPACFYIKHYSTNRRQLRNTEIPPQKSAGI